IEQLLERGRQTPIGDVVEPNRFRHLFAAEDGLFFEFALLLLLEVGGGDRYRDGDDRREREKADERISALRVIARTVSVAPSHDESRHRSARFPFVLVISRLARLSRLRLLKLAPESLE